jgi:hypothetical protein
MPKITARRVHNVLLALVLVVGVGNLWATHDEVAAQQAAQRRAGELVEKAICTDLGTMAQIPAPAGPAATNPSRAYEQAEHRAWAGLYAGLGCGK